MLYYWPIAATIAIVLVTLGALIYYLRRSTGQHGNPNGAAFTVEDAQQQAAPKGRGQPNDVQHRPSTLWSSGETSQRVEQVIADDDLSMLVRRYVLHAEARRDALAGAWHSAGTGASRSIVEPVAA
ncbi:hypothetical protein GCM10022243_64450 [Saccharothrix violaceirubra]|uniref:Uncharacterized protein n=1 Tax=Saccharothrix violaceirubra TaxID=413306 RepID=A0A7W7T9N0_9PSEU|nr:hypothetical protein [Saccharothrix violaceirubra]MBB4969070.1 hypothetical protein [Saccharothrix violaceirubra]